MKYQIQSGVVLTEVCGEFLLVATAQARGKVAHARGLNRTGAYFWSLLEQGLDSKKIAEQAAAAYQRPMEEVAPVLQGFLDTLEQAHYLRREEEQP